VGLLSTITNALGLGRAIHAEEPGPLALSDGARARLTALGSQRVVEVRPTAMGARWLITVAERERAADDAPETALALVDPDGRTRGLELDFADGTWRLSVNLRVRAAPAPNPDGRTYLTSRTWAEGDPQFYTARTPNPPLLQQLFAVGEVDTVLLRGHVITLTRAPDASWSRLDRDIPTALRTYLLHGGLPLPARPRAPVDEDLLERARAHIEEHIAAMIRGDGGDIKLLDVIDGVAQVQLTGACEGCSASALTLYGGVQRSLTEAFPGQIIAVASA